MGDVKKVLASCKLKDREKHNSRLFIDLCENIHIHFREYRFIFSLPELFEFATIINESMEDVMNYLINNPDYKEGIYSTTIMIAGGKERQMKFLQKSPSPNKSYYDNNSFRIELQEEYVTDEIHIHLRDFRLVLNRENFKDLAIQFKRANDELERFEKSHNYERKKHVDREIESFNNDDARRPDKGHIQGSVRVKLDKIKSFWFKDIRKEWSPDNEYINYLKAKLQNEETILPIVISKELKGSHYIIDGHHRYHAALTSGADSIDAVITDITFEESEQIRKAEVLLKEFDKETSNRFRLSDFFKNYLAFSLNDYYKNSFSKLIAKRKAAPQISKSFPIRFIKRIFSMISS